MDYCSSPHLGRRGVSSTSDDGIFRRSTDPPWASRAIKSTQVRTCSTRDYCPGSTASRSRCVISFDDAALPVSRWAGRSGGEAGWDDGPPRQITPCDELNCGMLTRITSTIKRPMVTEVVRVFDTVAEWLRRLTRNQFPSGSQVRVLSVS